MTVRNRIAQLFIATLLASAVPALAGPVIFPWKNAYAVEFDWSQATGQWIAVQNSQSIARFQLSVETLPNGRNILFVTEYDPTSGALIARGSTVQQSPHQANVNVRLTDAGGAEQDITMTTYGSAQSPTKALTISIASPNNISPAPTFEMDRR